MSNNTIRIGVEINLNGTKSTVSEIGLYSGRLRYAENDTFLGGLNTKKGVLSKKWVSSITKSVDVRRTGNYASLNGASVKISNNFGLMEWLKDNNKSLYTSKIIIFYEYTSGEGVTKTGKLYTGMVTSVTPDFDFLNIKTESLSKDYYSPAAEIIQNREEYKPVFLGASEDSTTPDTSVKYTKGYVVSEPNKDIPVPGSGRTVVWEVAKSSKDILEVYPIGSTLTDTELIEYANILKGTGNSTIAGAPYVESLSGAGSGEIFPISILAGTSTIIQRTVDGEVQKGLKVRMAGTRNKWPDGIRGAEADIYNNGEYVVPEEPFTILKFIEVNEFVQMDGWDNTRYTYKGFAYSYDEDSGEYVEAPVYGGGYRNDGGDKMRRDNAIGDALLEPGLIDGERQVYQPSIFELKDLTEDLFPEEIRDFFCLNDEFRISSSIWARHVSYSNPSTYGSSLANYPNIVDGDINSSFTVGVKDDPNVTDPEFTKAAYVFRLGMPQFKKKPNKIYLTMKARVQVDLLDRQDIMIGMFINDFRGYQMVDYKYFDDYQNARNNPPNNTSGIPRLIIDNVFPPAIGDNGHGSNNFFSTNYSYIDPNREGNKLNGVYMVNRDTLVLDLEEYLYTEQTEVFVVFAVKRPFNLSQAEFQVYEAAWSGEYEADPDKVVFDYEARELSNGVPMQKINQAYEHFLKLQNYKIHEIDRPVNGWGSAYPNTNQWDKYIDTSANYGGTNHPSIAPEAIIEGQKIGVQQSNTDAMKKELCKASWSMGTIDNEGVEKIFPLLYSVQEDTGTVISYHEVKDGYKFSVTLYTDIFTQGDVEYNFEQGSGLFNGKISVTSVDAESYSTDYVQGVTDATEAYELWSLANKLYRTYKVINPFPAEIGQVPLIKNEAGAVEFMKSLYMWQGVTTTETGGLNSLERYVVDFRVGLDFFIENDLDQGSMIRLDIPTITTGNLHNGIITSVSMVLGEKPTVNITATMFGDITAGGASFVIDESGDRTILIDESGTRTTVYREGE